MTTPLSQRWYTLPLLGFLLSACTDQQADNAPPSTITTSEVASGQASPAISAQTEHLPVPHIPAIVVPDYLSITAGQWQFQKALPAAMDPSSGVRILPARCDTQAKPQSSSDGTEYFNSEEGSTLVTAQGSGYISKTDFIVSTNDDGGGTLIAKLDDNNSITVFASSDGSGSYIGPEGRFDVYGNGSGVWRNGDSSISISKNGDAEMRNKHEKVYIYANGRGSWERDGHATQINNGDGTGTIGSPPVKVKMVPWQVPPKVANMPPLHKLSKPTPSCGYIVSLNDNILFDYDQYALKPEANGTLDEVAQAIQQVKVTNMEISGHTDSKGADDYNQTLSLNRAQSVLQALQQRGIAQTATAKGYGESQPIAPNEVNGQDAPANRQLNRRVEILIKAN